MKNTPATSLLALTVALSFALPAPAAAQAPVASDPVVDDELDPTQEATMGEILVIAQTLRGQVEAPEPPVLELNAEDIAAYGAGSVADLISALGPQTGSGSGRGGGFPVILVNGTRISSFRELRSYPPEAIEKVEVFSEDVAQRYGYSPTQRVVNFILKRNFSSREIEAEYGQPWDGGNSTKEVEATYLQLIGESRLNFNLGWEDTSLLTEAERGVIQSPGSVPGLATDPDPAAFRSLVSDSAGLEATGNFTTRLGDSGTSLSLNATFERSDSLRYQGLDTVVLTDPFGVSVLRTFGEDDPLTVDTRSDTYSLGATLNTSLGDWQITGTADASRVDSRSRIERRAEADEIEALQTAAAAGALALDADLVVPDAGFDQADSRTDTASGLVTAMGRPVLLPGGELSVTLDGGYNYTRIQSEDTRNPGVETSLERGDLSAGVNIGVPITSVREDFGAAIGDLNLSAAAGIDHLSDFGTLTDWSLGLNWGPTERLNFNVNYTARDAAPSLGQLGNPEIATPNVPVYDLSRGETVLATIVTGGNPLLPAQTQRDWRIGLNWELPEVPFLQQGRFRIEYFRNHSEDVAAGFPLLTPTIESAFPGRVTRDPVTGQITQIDQRPVTFAEQNSQRIQVGLNLSGPFGKARPEAAARQQANNPMAQAFRAANGGQQGGPGQAPGPGAAPGGQGFGGGFNPQAFQQVRERFCAPGAAVPTAQDLAGLPEPLVSRLKAEDGTIDPQRWAQFCSGPGGQGFDPARMAELRERFCGRPGETPPPITDEQLAALPPQMLERLRGPDGEIDQARLAQLRQQFCSGEFQPGQGGPPQGGQQAQGGQQGGPGGGPRGRGGGRFGGGSADGRGRWFVNFQYAYEIENEVLVAPGGPLLDLLDGDALGGSQPRHSVSFNGGLFYAGFGANVNARYTGASRIDGSELPGSTDLFFGDYATFNVRLFADLNQRTTLVEQVPLLKNTRITFEVNNVFDARQRVTDETGTVPLRYQPFLIDPVGRSFEIGLRKLF